MACEEKRVIGFALKSVNNLIRRKLGGRFAENGIEEICGMQGPMLGFISEKSKTQPVFQRDIEKEFNIRRSTATVMLQKLEQKDLIVREAVEEDARLKKIVLTPKAEALNLRIKEQVDAFHDELEAGLTEEEKEHFFVILDKIKRNLE